MPSPSIVTVPDGYSRRRTPPLLTLSLIPPFAFLLDSRSPFDNIHSVYVVSLRGEARVVRITGAVKTWKRSPRIVIPWKYGYSGMAEYGHFTSQDGSTWDPSSLTPYRLLSSTEDEPEQESTSRKGGCRSCHRPIGEPHAATCNLLRPLSSDDVVVYTDQCGTLEKES